MSGSASSTRSDSIPDVDAIVIGAGANGLAAATALARAGRKTLVVEMRPEVGGLAARREFAPGYACAVLSDSDLVRPALLAELELERHGATLRAAPIETTVLSAGGRLNLAAPPADIAPALESTRAFLGRIRQVLASFCDLPPLDVLELEAHSSIELLSRGLRLRRLGKADMIELLRAAPMALADWLHEQLGYSDASEQVAAAFAMPALRATYTAPRSPGGCANLLLLESMRGPGLSGGGPALIDALEKAARSAGVSIRTDAEVARIEVSDGRAIGIAFTNGEALSAPLIVASSNPRQTLLELVHPKHISVKLTERLHNYRCRGTTAHLALAVSKPLELPVKAVIADNLDDIERAFDAIKYGELPERPVVELSIPSREDSALAPAGHEVISALVHFVPPALEWTDERRETLSRRAIQRIAEHVPELTECLVAKRLLTPSDLERDYGLFGGNLHHGERAIDQLLVRPVPECSTYATPIVGLFLCGGGSHPGGGLHGGSGRLAAKAILG